MVAYIIFLFIGLLILCFQGYQIWNFAHAEKASAVIVDSESRMRHVRYLYQFSYQGQNYTIWGPLHETLNPLETILPIIKVGKEEQIRFRSDSMTILSLGFWNILWIFLGFSIILTGILGIAILLMATV